MADIVLSYRPREHFLPFHERETRWGVMVAHRRAGKTVACVNELIHRAMYTQKKRARFAYMGPFYSQTKQIAWEYLKEYATPIADKVMESELSVTLRHNGAKIQLWGADNPDRMRGLYFDGVVLDEYGDMKPSVWSKVILPTLADRRGWAVFIGTPKGKNHFYKIFQRSLGLAPGVNYGEDPAELRATWFNFTLRASTSGILPDAELAMQRAEMSEDEYLQEFECSFDAAVMGTYYAKLVNLIEQRNQIRRDIAYDPEFPVHVAADLGFTDSTSLWFWQERPDGLAIIDYEEASGQALAYYFELLKNKGYKYGKIWLPHDARAKSLQTGRSTIEQFLEQQFPLFDEKAPACVDIAPMLSLQHGIDAVRLILPSCYFNLGLCDEGVEGLRAYRRKWDEEKKVFSDAPVHDWTSHPSDAFRYLALVAKERILRAPEPQIIVPAPLKITQYSLDDLYAMQPKNQRERV